MISAGRSVTILNMQIHKLLPLLLVILLSVAACAKKAPPPQEPSYHTHTVSAQGETLAIIASWYTGDSQNWKAIADATPGLKPNKMRIGDVVNIPAQLVIKHEPLTKKALQQYLKRAVKAEPKNAPTPTPVPEITSAPEVQSQTSSTQVESQLEAALPEPTTAPAVATTPEIQSAPVETPIAAPVVDTPESVAVVATPSSAEKTRDDLIDEILSK